MQIEAGQRTRPAGSRLGILDERHRAGLAVLPGWDAPGPKKGREDLLWSWKLEGLAAYLQAGIDCPRNGTREAKKSAPTADGGDNGISATPPS